MQAELIGQEVRILRKTLQKVLRRQDFALLLPNHVLRVNHVDREFRVVGDTLESGEVLAGNRSPRPGAAARGDRCE